jgi:AcrR family transcriptional regulator
MPLTQLPLRERKHATQKLKILDIFEEKLKEKSLADISVKEVAQALEISEMTFFNYFKNKGEVLVYFIELWSLEMQLKIEKKQPIEAIYLIFEETAKLIEQNYQLFMEIVSAMALYGMSQKDIAIGRAERLIRFGLRCEHQEGGFRELIMPLIEKVNVPKERRFFVYTALHNTLFSTPLLMKCQGFGRLKERYFEQIDTILKAFNTKEMK